MILNKRDKLVLIKWKINRFCFDLLLDNYLLKRFYSVIVSYDARFICTKKRRKKLAMRDIEW